MAPNSDRDRDKRSKRPPPSSAKLPTSRPSPKPHSSSKHQPSSSRYEPQDRRSPADRSTRMDSSRSRTQAAGPAAMGSHKVRPMARPGFGQAGRPVKLETNFFKMSIPRNLKVSQYSIQILRLKRPESDDRRNRRSRAPRTGASASSAKQWIDVSGSEPITFNRAVFDQVCRRYGHEFGCPLAYDGRSIAYAAREVNRRCLGTNYKVLVGREGNAATEDEIRGNNAEEVQVRIEHAKYLKFDDILSDRIGTIASAEFLAALDVVIATTPMGRYVQIGRSFYSPHGAQPLGNRAVVASAWRGFYQSARLSLSGLVVNLDESFSAFWNKGGRPLMDLVFEANERHELRSDDTRRLREVGQRLKSLKVRAIHTKITYKVHGFSNKGADRIFFKSSTDDRQVSISDYFKDTYGINLRHPNWPCVKTNPKRDTYLPMELLIVVENQRLAGSILSQEQTQGIVKIASSKPHVRREAAVKTIQKLNHSADRVCKDFGVGVAPGLIPVQARILPVPSIRYRKGTVLPSDGFWKPSNQQFASPATLWTWAVGNMSHLKDSEVADFARTLARSGRRSGMSISVDSPRIFKVRPDRAEDELRRVARQYEKGSPLCIENYPLQLIVIIKDRQDAKVYNTIKRFGDLEVGVATQVCLQKHCGNQGKKRETYCDNVILKINSKLGGQNSFVGPYAERSSQLRDVPFLERPHIVLGADVTHPMAGGKSPSVAALVGSRDRQGVQYTGAIRNQPGKQEVIVELGSMFKEVYYRWYQNFEGKWHVESIIMFRDGVSDGQFDEVLQVELEALRKACKDISQNFRPAITYIIVTKRHHARFFADRQNSDRSGNILPGTVIDRDITSREFYDFYLNSHAGIQGTNRPSKYTVLIDENNIPVDVLQGYIFRLSHGFVRCNRSVSIVNSVYYAHLLAFRGRAYLGEDISDTASIGSTESQVPRATLLHQYLSKRLFFV